MVKKQNAVNVLKCLKILYTKFMSDKVAYPNSADPNQSAPERVV